MLINSSRVKAVCHWLFIEARHFWIASIVIIIALVLSLLLFKTELAIRLTGGALQLLGIGTVIWGINETRALFGHPSFVNKVKAWLRRSPLFRRDIVCHVAAGEFRSDAGKMSGYVTRVAAVDSTIEERLKTLEENVRSAHKRISQTQDEMDREFQKTADVLKREEQLRQGEDIAIRKLLEATGTGGVHISLNWCSMAFCWGHSQHCR